MLFTNVYKEKIEEKKKKKIATLIPCGDIPENGPQTHYKIFRNTTNKWLGNDSFKHYQEAGGHPFYDEDSIDYTLNSKGYRCPEFNLTADIKIISLGCSYVFGVGIRQCELYHEIIASKLRETLDCSVINWNLGSGGASNDFIARVLYTSLPVLKPDLILVNFSGPARREFYASNGDWIKYTPNNKISWFEGVAKEIHILQKKMESEYQDILHFYNLLKGIEAKINNENHIFSCIYEEKYTNMLSFFNQNYIGGFEHVDTARDHVHAGPKSHEIIANRCWNHMRSNGILNKLKKIAAKKREALSILQ